MTLAFPYGRTVDVKAGCFEKPGEFPAQLGQEHATNSLISLHQLQTPSPRLSLYMCTVLPLRLMGQTAQDYFYHVSLQPGWHPHSDSAIPRNNVQVYNSCE